ncbi:hypothetical protein [Burkholderia ubonensis]|uniref:hypothetical protein n=1 Tax=Burkholderia ubonensis TaxID=101571 RepID=UPI000AB8AD5E|nr:hypothetical protein [Burkholderia ubonensis]
MGAPTSNNDSIAHSASTGTDDSTPSIGRRVGRYFAAHIFEAIALSLSLVTGLAYVIGRSYLNGWEEAAGIPGLMFRRDLSDVMLAGATVSRVWMMPLLFFLAPVLIVWLLATVPAWLGTRWPFVRLKSCYRRTRRVLRSGVDQIELRHRFAAAARAATRGVAPQARFECNAWWRWKVLGPRGPVLAERDPVVRSHRTMQRITLVMLLAVVPTEGVLTGYTLFVKAFLDEPRLLGREDFAKIYLAVTGRVPYQYDGDRSLSAQELQDWACEGRKMLWQYRAVTLTHSANPAVPDATYYLLQGVDHTFMLLGEAGSIIRSLGNAPFLMAESKSRPLSPLAQGCKLIR